MTKFILENYIPKNDIKIIPKELIKKIENLFDTEIEDLTFEDKTSKIRLNYINYIYKKIKKLIINYHFWNSISSYNFCCYQYRNTKKNETDDENVGRICGRRIDKKKTYDDDSNKYLCSEHDRNHRKYHSISIKIKENEIGCKHIKKDGSNCRYGSKINGLCLKHHKYIYKINKKEILNNIIFYKYYTNIDDEIKILLNIKYDIYDFGDNIKNENLKKVHVTRTFENNKNEVAGNGFLKNNKIKKVYENVFDIENEDENLSNLKKVTYCTITNPKNNKILDNLKNNYNNNYFKIKQEKCLHVNCNNNKKYYIQYFSYCDDHIINTEKIRSPSNFFYKHNTTTTTTTTTTTQQSATTITDSC